MDVKQCTTSYGCGVIKPVSEFYADKKTGGFQNGCKECRSKRSAKLNPPKNPIDRMGIVERTEHLLPKYDKPLIAGHHLKQCRKCNHIKDLVEFPLAKGMRDGRAWECRECEKDRKHKEAERKGRVYVPTVASKICGRCSLEKLAQDFPSDPWNADGLGATCRTCLAIKPEMSPAQLESFLKKRTSKLAVEAGMSELPQHHIKKCSECKRIKELDEFYLFDKHVDGHAATCKECSADGFKYNYISFKARARRQLKRARGNGKVIIPDRCDSCNTQGDVHGHHTDYTKPLDVEWLCPKCHSEWHANHRFVEFLINPKEFNPKGDYIEEFVMRSAEPKRIAGYYVLYELPDRVSVIVTMLTDRGLAVL